MKTLTEVIDGFEGTLEEDSIEGVREFYEYLSMQDDYSVSEKDFVYLNQKRKEIRSHPDRSEISGSELFFCVLFDYTMKGIEGSNADTFKKANYSIIKGNMTMEQEDGLIKKMHEEGLPDLKGLKQRCEEIRIMFKDYVFNAPNEHISETTHYVNNSLTPITANVSLFY